MGFGWTRRHLSVGAKFALITTIFTAIVMTSCFAIVTRRLQAADAGRSEEIAREATARLCVAVQGLFEGAVSVVGATHDNLIAFKDAGITDRHVYETTLAQMIASGSDRYGAWLVWDAADAPREPKSAQENDRFDPYWHQNGIEMLRDHVPKEILESDLFRVPHESDRSVLLEPHVITAVAGDPTLVTSFSKPLEHDGKIVGVLAIDLKLDAIDEALGAIALPRGASLTIVSDGGIVAMSTAKGLVGKDLASVSPSSVPLFQAAKLADGSRIVGDPSSGADVLQSWNAIRFAGVKNPWFLLMTVPEQSLLATTSNDRAFLLAVAGSALLTVLFVVLAAMNRLVAAPLKRLSVIINGLGTGLFDFTVPGGRRNDEVGDIARAVQRLQQNGLEIAQLQAAGGEREFQRQHERREELNGISAQFSRSIETSVLTLDSVASTVDIQSREVSLSTKAAVERLSDVSDASAVAKASMASVARATSSLLATIDAIGERVHEGRAAAEKVEHHTNSTDRSIERLKKAIGEIDRVAALIREVAGQINLIALNATIEAARAGQAGRGFAVVAQEIKVLAKRTAEATGHIGGQIDAVRSASGLADGTISDMKDAFAEMRAISGEIASALDVQLGATRDIGALVEGALNGADRVAANVSELVGSSRKVQGAADVMLGQSGSLGAEIGGLRREVLSFLQFLKAA